MGQIRELIDKKAYFIIHAPRQTGKTTLIRSLSRKLTAEGKYAAVTVSLESFTLPSVKEMIPQMLVAIRDESSIQLPGELHAPAESTFSHNPHIGLKTFLRTWSSRIPRPLVLLIHSRPGPRGRAGWKAPNCKPHLCRDNPAGFDLHAADVH